MKALKCARDPGSRRCCPMRQVARRRAQVADRSCRRRSCIVPEVGAILSFHGQTLVVRSGGWSEVVALDL